MLNMLKLKKKLEAKKEDKKEVESKKENIEDKKEKTNTKDKTKILNFNDLKFKEEKDKLGFSFKVANLPNVGAQVRLGLSRFTDEYQIKGALKNEWIKVTDENKVMRDINSYLTKEETNNYKVSSVKDLEKILPNTKISNHRVSYSSAKGYFDTIKKSNTVGEDSIYETTINNKKLIVHVAHGSQDQYLKFYDDSGNQIKTSENSMSKHNFQEVYNYLKGNEYTKEQVIKAKNNPLDEQIEDIKREKTTQNKIPFKTDKESGKSVCKISNEIRLVYHPEKRARGRIIEPYYELEYGNRYTDGKVFDITEKEANFIYSKFKENPKELENIVKESKWRYSLSENLKGIMSKKDLEDVSQENKEKISFNKSRKEDSKGNDVKAKRRIKEEKTKRGGRKDIKEDNKKENNKYDEEMEQMARREEMRAYHDFYNNGGRFADGSDKNPFR